MLELINRLNGSYPKSALLARYFLVVTIVFWYTVFSAGNYIMTGAPEIPPADNLLQKSEAIVMENVRWEKVPQSAPVINYKKVPVLIYHYIKDSKDGSDLNMPPVMFREQMKYIKENKYTTITLDELYAHYDNGSPLPEKPVVITFDDGAKDLYFNAYPILKEFGLKATIFVITSYIDKHPNVLTSTQLLELQNNGIEIESHTNKHEQLDSLDYDRQLATLKESKEFLDKLLRKNVKYLAYPYGTNNEDTVKAADAAGYKMAFTGKRGLAEKSQGMCGLYRIYIGKGDGMGIFKKVLNGDFTKMR